MNRPQRDTLLGAVFFGTMAFLLWATVNLTDVSLNQRAPLQVFFADAGGIRTGDPVLLLGKPVGKVGQIDFVRERQDKRMRLSLLVHEDLALSATTRIQIQDSGVLGGKQVYIDPGQGEPWPQTQELSGDTSGNALAAAGKFFDGEGPSGSELKAVLQEVRTFFRNLNDPQTSSIGALITSRGLYDEVDAAAKSVNRLLDAMKDGEGFLGRLIVDPTLRDDAQRIIANLASVSDQLKSTGGTLGRLLNDEEMSQQFARIAGNIDGIVARAADGQGFLGRLLEDDELANQLSSSMASLASVLKKADDPQAGLLGAALGDAQLKNDLQTIVQNLRDVTNKLNQGQGLLGALIHDEDMAAQMRRILTQVSRALEDAREAAPISNFVQVLFGAF